MPVELPQIFISSTSEFHGERRSIAERLRSMPSPRCEPFIYEEEGARGESPKDHCAAKIAASDVVVLILGATYGTPFPDDPTKSIVEWEYEHAKAHPRLAVQTYVKQPADGAGLDPRQKAFIDRVVDFSRGSWCKSFSAAQELIELVIGGIVGWAFSRAMEARRPGELRWKDRVALTVAGTVGIATLAGVVAGAVAGASTSSLLIVAGTGLGILVVLFPMLKSTTL